MPEFQVGDLIPNDIPVKTAHSIRCDGANLVAWSGTIADYLEHFKRSKRSVLWIYRDVPYPSYFPSKPGEYMQIRIKAEFRKKVGQFKVTAVTPSNMRP